MASSVSRGRPGTDPLASGRVRIPGPSGRDLDRDADRDQRHRLHGRADDPGRSRARDGGDRRGRRRARGDPREVRAERSDPRPVPALGGARAPGRPRPLDPDARPGDDDRGQEAADHLRTAYGKGLAGPAVIFRHAIRNSLIPVVTILGLQAGALMSGAVVTEQIFVVPGFGCLIVEAVFTRDYPVVQGVVLITASSYVLINLLVDVSYSLLDPRIRFGGGS